MEDIRWKQRYQNYLKACTQLDKFVDITNLNELEEQGLIQCFEYTFELAWKTMKDYLSYNGYDVKSPRETIQIAFQSDLITDGHTWLDALQKRNLMAHTYDSELASEAITLIRTKYHLILKSLNKTLRGKL